MPKKIPGYNFLENHPIEEAKLNLDPEHVIVDKRDWDLILDYLYRNPHILEKLDNKNIPWFG